MSRASFLFITKTYIVIINHLANLHHFTYIHKNSGKKKGLIDLLSPLLVWLFVVARFFLFFVILHL